MRQFQFSYKGDDALTRELRKISQWSKTKIYSHMLFQILSDTLDREKIENLMDTIRQEMPDALIFGCSTNGHIVNGELSNREISITCTVFEFPTTQVKLLQYDLNSENEEWVTDEVLRELEQNPWVTAIELLATIRFLRPAEGCKGRRGDLWRRRI